MNEQSLKAHIVKQFKKLEDRYAYQPKVPVDRDHQETRVEDVQKILVGAKNDGQDQDA